MNLASKPNKDINTHSPQSAMKVMIVAGEASGDLHAASVARSILRNYPNAEIFGMGGCLMREAGVETVLDSEKVASVMGISEVLGKFFELRKAILDLKELASTKRPDIVLLVDFPDFNYFLAKAIKTDKTINSSPQIIHFITPTVWAWRKGRVKTIKKYIDLAIPLYPFEEKFFKEKGVTSKYLGHPFLDENIEPAKIQYFGLEHSRDLVTLLPGSRKAEISALLPDMLKASQILLDDNPNMQFALVVADSLKQSFLEEFGKNFPDIWQKIKIIKSSEQKGGAASLMKSSTLALTASGTVTVEGMLAGCPMVVIYRLSGFSYFIAKALVRGVKHFSMPNILAGKKVIPELLQKEVSPERIAKEAQKFISDAQLQKKTRKELSQLRESLESAHLFSSGSTTSERVAQVVEQRALRLG